MPWTLPPNAEVHLSTGTYFGTAAAIQTEDGDLAALLEPGYAYFDGSGNLLRPEEAVGAKKFVIGQCPGHSGKNLRAHIRHHDAHLDLPVLRHEGDGECSFTFVQDGRTCDLCKNMNAIAVD